MPRLFLPKAKHALLLGMAVIAAPLPAFAQMLETEWEPMDAESAPVKSDAAAPKRASAERQRLDVTPYIEAQQVLLADLDDGGEVLTYSTIAVGVEASVSERNAQAQVNVRYERLIGYDSNVRDQDIISGLARGTARLGKNVSIEAGGYASRSKIDSRGDIGANRQCQPILFDLYRSDLRRTD